MSSGGATFATNVRWEVTRLRRSRRIWLLLIPPIAGPVGSSIADLYLRVPLADTAVILGLLVTAGLASLILLDLTALAVGEDLARRAHLATFPLPQDRRLALSGRLFVAIGGPILGYLVGAALITEIGGSWVVTGASIARALFPPGHLLWAILGLLLALAGATSVAAVVTRSASEAIVAGVLTGVVVAGGIGYLVAQGEVSMLDPLALGLAGAVALGVAIARYGEIAE